jgi:hypothetical protein
MPREGDDAHPLSAARRAAMRAQRSVPSSPDAVARRREPRPRRDIRRGHERHRAAQSTAEAFARLATRAKTTDVL